MNQSASFSASPREERWQSEFLSHAPEFGAEFAGTCFLMFALVGMVAFLFATHSVARSWIPPAHLRYLLAGMVLGGVGGLVAITPLGRTSGAHLNPAVSLGLFTEGKMKPLDLIAYIVAQLAGATLGTWLGSLAFPQIAKSVQDALNQPKQTPAGWAMAAEFGCTFAVVTVILWMVSRKSTMRWTPLALTGVVAVLVCADGAFSSASLNTARSFGPALVSGDWSHFWIYVAGPCGGGAFAGLLHRYAAPVRARTGKIFHDLHYRSIFRGDSDHEANDRLRQQAGIADEGRPPVHRGERADGQTAAE